MEVMLVIRKSMEAAALAGLLLLARAPVSRAAENAPDYSAIDQFVQSRVQVNRFPGVALAVLEGDSVVYARGFGHDAAGQPVTTQTPFMIGSNSKSFTALAVMQLKEAGAVDLDAPVQRYLPDFQLADAAAAAQISVRHLLNQTSGIPATAAGDLLLEFQAGSLQQAMAELRNVQPHAPPGAAYEYANANYMLLGMIIEAASHQPYAAYVQNNILDPLGMTQTRLDSGAAVGYRYWLGVPLPDPMPYDVTFASVPTGGVTSTAEDMAHYLSMYLNGGEYEGRQLLSQAGVAELHRGVSDVTFNEGDQIIRLSYGMGWASGDIGGIPAIYHTGGSPQFSSWMVLIPQENRAFITMMNANNWIPGPGVSSTELIPKGVMLLLAGRTPEQGTSLASMYLWIDVFCAVLIAALTWSLARRLRHPVTAGDTWLQRARRVGPLMWEIGLPLLLLAGFPQLFEVQSWTHVMTYTPDLGSLVLLATILWFVTGLTRVIKLRVAGPSQCEQSVQRAPAHVQEVAL
jgi:CubicO group peptidase (beta-lactamase class C family)